ncbi:Hypothetical_protein [Hexamita inflata]|uniref:Hypothetical_protein n=1 Tax=Hexamita inflata TaxID=28002 RepID=A0AA86UHN0_9EUKA|nr:Hypothetical protein HINF_LOCUS39137 [Hexamita inflata]
MQVTKQQVARQQILLLFIKYRRNTIVYKVKYGAGRMSEPSLMFPIKIKYYITSESLKFENYKNVTAQISFKNSKDKQVIKDYIPGLDVTAAEAKGIMGMNIVAAKQSQLTRHKQQLNEEEEYKDNQ